MNRRKYFAMLTVLCGTLAVLGGCKPKVQNASELRLVPFPKQVTMEAGQGFSLKATLQLRVATKDRDILVASLIDELKRAGFPAPQPVDGDCEKNCLMLTVSGVTLDIPTLPDGAGEGKSDVGEAYAMTVSPKGVVCTGKDESGLYYAVQTLRQLIRANTDASGKLPCLTIRDWPSMKYRCFQDDWTRGPSPYLHAAFEQFDIGSFLKHNMFTYYMEDQFEYKKHPKISPKDGTMTQEEFKQCVEYAAKRHLIMLGNQQSFAHHYKMNAIPEYVHLLEAGYILSPTVEAVYPFLDGLYSEIMPLVPFEMFNVCCDETDDLAQSGPSKALADKIGVGGVYVQHILRIRELLRKYDKRMMMWGDVIMHHPDKLNLIPKDVVMMCWHYEPLPDFDAYIKPFSESGYEFFVCPGYSNWNVILPLFKKATVNIQNFVRDGCANGAIGMLNTGWEDDGEVLHGNTWHGIAWGAECSWNASKTDIADFNRRLGPALFGAKGDDFGRAIEMLGELQGTPELWGANNTRFWEWDFVLQQTPDIIEKCAKRILELVQPAIKHLEITKEQATVNADLLDAFLFGARRMELIGTRMLDGVEVLQRYTAASALDLTVPAQKKTVLDELDIIDSIIDRNRKAHSAFKTEFVRLWNNESKPFSLDNTTRKYDNMDTLFAELQQKVRDVRTDIVSNGKTVLPDIGLTSNMPMRKTSPARVVSHGLSSELKSKSELKSESPWTNPQARLRLGLTVEAGNVERIAMPVELDVELPDACIGKQVEAYLLDVGGNAPHLIPSQLDPANHPQKPNLQRLTLLIPAMAKEKSANIYVYFGLDKAATPFPKVTASDGENGMKVIDNDLVQIYLNTDGGIACRWLVKDLNNEDMTNPDPNRGFGDHGSTGRTQPFELVCMNNGPAMVRYGYFSNGEHVKTLTVYTGLPLLDVTTVYPTWSYWDFDATNLFDADGKTAARYLFADGKTGPTTTKVNRFVWGQGFWALKTNEQGLVHGITTPEASSIFFMHTAGGSGGIGVQLQPRFHFITWAGICAKNQSDGIMEQIKNTYNLKNQPVVTLYAQEQK